MRTFARYLAFQAPGWLLAAVIAYALYAWLNVPAWVAAALTVAYVVKDLALFPLLRRAYQPVEKSGAELLVGETAVVRKNLNPEGYVEVRGELWLAEVGRGSRPALVNSHVRVEAAHGMKLTVRQIDGSHSG